MSIIIRFSSALLAMTACAAPVSTMRYQHQDLTRDATVANAHVQLDPQTQASKKTSPRAQMSASSLSPSELFSKTAKSTVMVIALDADGEPVSRASGFFF